MTDRLRGQVAVITGASSGIGAATAARFVTEGASVVLADVQDEAGRSLAAELGERAEFVSTDVTSEDSVRDVVDFAVQRFGRLDVMFNNAGVIGAVGRIADTSTSDFEFTSAVLLRGTFFGMKHAARQMTIQRSGLILSTTSPAAVSGGMGPHVYSACKAAVIALTNSVAAELRPFGVRVNAIMPGATVTAMTADLVTGSANDLEGARVVLAAASDTTRAILASDIAGGAVYLASADGELITAITLAIDGGLSGAPGGSPYANDQYAGAPVIREAGRRGTDPMDGGPRLSTGVAR